MRDEILGRAKFPSLAKEGWLRPLRKCCAASLAGADGVVGSSHRLSVVEQTTPAAPSKEGAHFLDGAATPPWPRRGVSRAQKSRLVSFQFHRFSMRRMAIRVSP